jgi:hypothetical protein
MDEESSSERFVTFYQTTHYQSKKTTVLKLLNDYKIVMASKPEVCKNGHHKRDNQMKIIVIQGPVIFYAAPCKSEGH